ncbi:MAG TPA: FUSC family protein [Solirubrobacterales bacterium]
MPERQLFNASGMATRLRASPLTAVGPAEPGPAVRRGFLIAIPIGAALLAELGLDSPTKGAIATGALLAGFPAMDAPAKVRAAWQAAAAPLIAIAAALGVLTGASPWLAVPTMALVGAAAGYCSSVSPRFLIFGLSIALSLLIAQGLPLDAADVPAALALTTAGGLLQAAWSLAVRAAGDRGAEGPENAWSTERAAGLLRSNFSLDSIAARHAVRFGLALAAGVAAYWALGMQEHGFWIPLTILFVLRPVREETMHRLVLRAVGTAAGLLIATALSFWLQDAPVALALVLTVAAGFSYGLLTVQYALFTTAITVFAVVMADTLGEPELAAAGQRGIATAIGIAIAGAAFALWSNPPKLEARPA